MAWNTVLAQFLVVRGMDDRPIGLVVCCRANFQHGTAYLAVTGFEAKRSPLMILGVTLFINYVFACWNFHKLYMEVPEYNYPQFASGVGKSFELEGRLREHLFYRGERWDELVLAIFREPWLERARKRLRVELMGDEDRRSQGWRTVTLRFPPDRKSS